MWDNCTTKRLAHLLGCGVVGVVGVLIGLTPLASKLTHLYAFYLYLFSFLTGVSQ